MLFLVGSILSCPGFILFDGMFLSTVHDIAGSAFSTFSDRPAGTLRICEYPGGDHVIFVG